MQTITDLPAAAPSASRRHDLDAVRAGAMLLGIVLHAALAFAPIPWIVTNGETSPVFGVVIEVIHGFRLPLFFLLSGYFSAMLLERRGVGGFLRHRWKRIAIPFGLGTVTIVPAMWAVIIGGSMMSGSIGPATDGVVATPDGELDLWTAAAVGDVERVRVLIEAGASVDQPDPRSSTLPLAWAATGDHAGVVALLLEAGADPNQPMIDANIPLHTALFFGAAESAKLMLDAGADAAARNAGGETPLDSMRHGAGAVAFIANLLGVEADFGRVEAGRLEISELLDDQAVSAESRDPRGPVGRALDWLVGTEVFMHLWFLWHLCWLACGLAAVSGLKRVLPRFRVPWSVVATPVCLVFLLPLTALTQSWQAGFGPDTSAGLIPAPHVLAHYGVFFGFGALMHATVGAADRLGRTWWVYLPLAALIGVSALHVTHDPASLDSLGLSSAVGSVVIAVAQSAFVWTVSFGVLGLARTILRAPSACVRYISDSSYWLYIAHLPVVLAGQFVFARTSWPASVEFTLLTVGTTGALLVVYHWVIRHRWIGRLLNGPRG